MYPPGGDVTSERKANGPLRDELWRVEDRLTSRIDRTRTLLETYIRDHSVLHKEHDDWSAARLAEIKDAFGGISEREQRDEIGAARRAGTWSLLLLGVTVISRYWVIVVAALIALAATLGNLRIDFGQ